VLICQIHSNITLFQAAYAPLDDLRRNEDLTTVFHSSIQVVRHSQTGPRFSPWRLHVVVPFLPFIEATLLRLYGLIYFHSSISLTPILKRHMYYFTYEHIHQPVCLWLYSPCGPWPFFHFLDLYTVGRTPWTGDQPVARPLPKEDNINAE
jgi:hypothetical protein